MAACVQHIRRAALPPATSVFFGGGTPSLVAPELLVRVLDAIDRTDDAEVTVECNPETIDAAAVRAYRNGGVNRLSFGVQSMVPHVLDALGRHHDPATVRRAVDDARDAGFTSWNADVIFGGAGESLDDWKRTLDDVVALDPPHVSAYALTVEAGTPLARDRARHPDDDDLAAKYAIADRAFAAAGLEWYEISNWSRPGHECRHNSLYWSGDPYRGIGCAAHSFDGERRSWNVRTPDRYIALVEAGADVEAAGEHLDAQALEFERLTLQLRTRDGVPAEALPDDARAEVAHLVEERGGRVLLTRQGRLLANEVALRLVPAR